MLREITITNESLTNFSAADLERHTHTREHAIAKNAYINTNYDYARIR